MFNKLYRQIFNSLFWLAFAFALLLSSASGFVVMRNLYRQYDSMTEGSVAQAAMYGNNRLNSVSNAVHSASQSSDIVLALTQGQTQNVSRALANLINSGEAAGAVLYGVNGAVFYTSGVGDVPTLETLRTDLHLQAFLDGSEQQAVLLRTMALPGVYNFSPFEPSQGVVSCVSKVFDGGKTVGFLFADVLNGNLLDEVLAVAGEDSLVAAIVTPYSSVADALPDDDPWRFFRYTQPFEGGGDYVFCVSLADYYADCAVVGAVLLGTDIVCLTLVALLARHIAKKVTRPLDRLQNTMQNEKLT